jgi:ABC-2 type transport system ATP-binding protein
VIEAHSLTKRYGRTVAVDDLSFVVRPGRVTGFLGPNGAGKSTTMRLILGLDRPDRGSVTIAGQPYERLRRPLLEVGAMLDARAVHGGRTAEDHLLALATSNGIGRRRVREVLDLVGLSEVRRRRVGGFSLGMSQRLGIAAALLGDPPVLMFDEPVNGLDPEGVRWMRHTFRTLAEEGRTVLLSSHLLSEMAVTADHLLVVGRGRLIADASTHDVINQSSSSYVLLRSPQAAELARIAERHGADTQWQADGALHVRGLTCAEIGDHAAAAALPVHELTLKTASLEAAFLELTGDSTEFRVDTTPLATTASGAVR